MYDWATDDGANEYARIWALHLCCWLLLTLSRVRLELGRLVGLRLPGLACVVPFRLLLHGCLTT